MAADISADVVKDLRERTGVSLMECKRALVEAGGNLDKAVEVLRKKGMDTAAKKSGRDTKEGRILAYIHHNNKVGALVEVDCETDFVARNPEFVGFVSDIAMQVVANNPRYLSRDQVPADVVAKEKEIYAEQVKGKPANVTEKIVAGKLDKFYAENCLIEQPMIKDNAVTIQDHVKGLIAKLGENIIVRRFSRFEIGEGN